MITDFPIARFLVTCKRVLRSPFVINGDAIRSGYCRLLLMLAALVVAPLSAEAPSQIHLLADSRDAVSYALVRTDGTMLFSGHGKEFAAARSHRRQQASAYLWVRSQQQQFLIEDAGTLAELNTLWDVVSPYEQEMETLGQQMEQHGERLERLGAEWETLVDEYGVLDSDAMADFHQRQAQLHAEMEPLTARAEAVGEQLEASSETAHQRTLALIELAIKTGKAKRLAQGD